MKLFSQSPVILLVLGTAEWPLCPYFSPWALLFLSCWWRGNNRTTWWAPDGQPKSTHHWFVPRFFNADNKIMTFWLPSWAIIHDNLLEKYALIPLWSFKRISCCFPIIHQALVLSCSEKLHSFPLLKGRHWNRQPEA